MRWATTSEIRRLTKATHKRLQRERLMHMGVKYKEAYDGEPLVEWEELMGRDLDEANQYRKDLREPPPTA